MLDISNMVFGDHILCCSGVLESILWLPPKCIEYIISFSPNFSTSNRKTYGSILAKQIDTHPGNKMVLFIESRALQLEGACPDNHICQFRFKWGLCSEYYYHCQGILSSGDSPSRSFFVKSYHPGNFCVCVLLNEII